MKDKIKNIVPVVSIGAAFAVASVLFGSHAGAGFSTGNQEVTFFVVYGWLGPLMTILAMILLTAAVREAMLLYNNYNCENYTQMLKVLYDPYPQLIILFEIYFYMMVLIGVSSVIAGASAVITSYGIPKLIAVIVVASILLALTVFGAGLVSKAATLMSIVIIVCCFTIFISGIYTKAPELLSIFSKRGLLAPDLAFPWYKVIIVPFIYAGFQAVAIPTMVSVSKEMLKNSKEVTISMIISFIMNALALLLAIVMLLGWYSDFMSAGMRELPTLHVVKSLEFQPLEWLYTISLFFCLMSTGVTCMFGLISKFENSSLLNFAGSLQKRRILTAIVIMLISIGLSRFGLTFLVKYGYGNLGYVGAVLVVIPFITVGHYRNKQFKKNQGKDITVNNITVWRES